MHASFPDIGCIIDLTKANTGRFYNPSKEFKALGIKVQKIACAGFEAHPTTDQVTQFIKICKSFWDSNPARKVIGVHCTHGFNRTGYLLASFLHLEVGMPINAALLLFGNVRVPGIYKTDYVRSLLQEHMSGEANPAPMEKPVWEIPGATTPDKHAAAQKDLNKAENDTSDDAVGTGTFVIDGVEPVGAPMQGRLRKKVQQLMEASHPGFPGSQPVSLDWANGKQIQNKNYSVSYKSDGTRYLLLVLDGKAYMIGRDNCIFRVRNLVFPTAKSVHKEVPDMLKLALVDGELVKDTWTDPKSKQQMARWNYYAFDLMYCNGSYVDRPFEIRRKCLEHEVIRPITIWATKHKKKSHVNPPGNPNDWLKLARPPCRVVLKPFWEVHGKIDTSKGVRNGLQIVREIVENKVLLGLKGQQSTNLCHDTDGCVSLLCQASLSILVTHYILG